MRFTLKGSIFIIIACLLWAVDSLIRYPLLESGVTPLKIVFIEHFLLTLFFLPILIKSYQKLLDMKFVHLLNFGFIGVFGSALATMFFTQAFFLTNPSVVILLQKLQPLVAILLSRIYLKEKIGVQFLICTVVCLVGTMLIGHHEIFSDDLFSLKNASQRGILYALLAVVSWGASTVLGKNLSNNGYQTQEIMGGRFFIGLLTLFFLVGAKFTTWNYTADMGIKIFSMVILSGLLGMYFYYRGLERVSAKVCALLELSFPLFAVILNWVFLQRQLDIYQVFGGGLLLFGSSMVQFRKY